VAPKDQLRDRHDDAVAARVAGTAGPNPPLGRRRYRRMAIYAVLALAVVTVAPLVIMTWINYYQYEQAFDSDLTDRVARRTYNVKRTLEFMLTERLSALELVIDEIPAEELGDGARLRRLLRSMKTSFGGFVDLGLIDIDGRQISYAGPYQLQGKDYSDQAWYHEAKVRGSYVSDVFMGYRNFPHFVLAVRHDTGEDADFILRATIDSDMINRLVIDERQPFDDIFILNRDGVLQTPSRLYGKVLQRIPFAVPPLSDQAEISDLLGEQGDPLVVGGAQVERSPFAVLVVSRPGAMQESWSSLRRELIGFLSISIVLILGVVVWGATWMVKRIREADVKRAAIFHKMEYTNRMAVIGRLAAGVAHEINNPLAVINEKAGLLNDLLTLSDEPPSKEKVLSLVGSVLKSVDRCSTITHRLLGFAKQMDVKRDKIHLKPLLEEVLGFLGKEAHYRDIQVSFHIPDDLPPIVSDRGQLQQVFLNIINNAFMALEDQGRLDISAERRGAGEIAIRVTDNGVGIPKENLENIFEPFFTTKPGYGTGLGLSITYGIVDKLGGQISVESEVGVGTTFTVVLPIEQGRA